MALVSLANTYWHQKQYVRAWWLIVQSLLILPPWASPNSDLIFRKAVEQFSAAHSPSRAQQGGVSGGQSVGFS